MTATFDMTFTDLPGGPCPVCHHSGLLLRHYGCHAGYRTLAHLDEQGQEHVCTLPEVEGILYTSGGGWWYVPGPRPEPSRSTSEEQR